FRHSAPSARYARGNAPCAEGLKHFTNMIINGKTGSSQLFLNDFRAWIGYHMGVSRIHTQIYEDYKYKLEGSEIYVCDA
ncbi:MAG: hypothetical protein LUE94_03140, partial [Clostridiales bacterium]|nr:hypothetical protein [Clostridiales bacterium]